MNNNISKKTINANDSNSSKEQYENIKQDIIINSKQLEMDSFFKKKYGDRETLFYVALPSFKKLLKDDIDKKLISLYLSQMKKFIQLLQKVSLSNNNNTNINDKDGNSDEFYELINNVSAHMLYHYFPANRVLMRYGDEGENFYILLNGTVTIIVARKKAINLSLNEYFRYIALLILYKEQQILKQVVKENKNTNYIEIPGINYFFVISNEPNPLILIRDIYLLKYNIKNDTKNNSSKLNNSKSKESFLSEKSKKKLEKRRTKSSCHEKKVNYFKELESEFIKVEEFLNIYLTEEELRFYYASLLDEKYDIFEIDDNYDITPEKYVQRIQNYFFDINNFKKKKIPNMKEKINDIMTNETKTTKIILYEYNILLELNSGDMFGEAALSAPSLKRNATIMTVTDCHFGCLNRKIYQKHIQKATETNKKNIINYICSTGIFNGFPKEIMNKKFFSVFVFKKNKKNDYIIKQNESNSNIVLIKEGVYEIILNGNMFDIYNLINNYYKKLYSIDKKNIEHDEEMNKKISKIKEQKGRIEKIFGNEMYKNEEHKILLIDSPSTFGLREFEEKITIRHNAGNISYQYLSYYDVKCNSLKGEYILIDKNTFYKQIYGTEYIVQESTNIICKQFIEKIINRLMYIRLSKIYNILLTKGFNKEKYNLYFDKNNSEGNHHNLSFSNSNDFYKRINSLIDSCDESKFSSNNFEDYIFNYFENKKVQNLKEKREFKNRKERFKQNEIKKSFIKEHSDYNYYTNTNSNAKNFSMTRISSAINNSKLNLCLNKDKDKFHLSKKQKLILIPVIKNKRNYNLKYKKKTISYSPNTLAKKVNIHRKKFPKDKDESLNENSITNKMSHKINKYFFQESFISMEKNDLLNDKLRIDHEDNKNLSIHNINPKFKIIGGKHCLSMPKMILNKSRSVYEIKAQNHENFIKNRSNYIINITRSFFTKKKDFNRKIRLKSS